MIAISQAWHPIKPKPEYVGFDFKAALGSGFIVTLYDTSGAPSSIIMEGHSTSGRVIKGNITINDKVYYYPDDFDYNETFHIEFSLITKMGFLRAEAIYTFKKLPGHPTLTDWIVSHITNAWDYPNTKYGGQFKITGTKMFDNVEGFGIDEGYYPGPVYPPDPTAVSIVHHCGFIKDWPL
jgi:hypothetical protein